MTHPKTKADMILVLEDHRSISSEATVAAEDEAISEDPFLPGTPMT